MSKHFALIGYPLTFSMSPNIYIPWFRKYNIDATYEVIPLKEEELDNFFRNQARNYFDGINITTPYKETAVKFVDELSDLAKMTGSINCIKREGKRLIADNTDIYGFSEMVSDIDFTGKKVIIVGAGGAAISALHVLEKYSPDVMNRTDRNVLGKKTISYEISKLQNYDIIINATTIALFSLLDLSLDQKILIDLNYKFTGEYKNIPNIMTGEKMLLKQAEKAFQTWFGLSAYMVTTNS